MEPTAILQKRKLPKLMACMTKGSLENMRNKALFHLDVLDARGIRRRKFPLHECLIAELKEAGLTESSDYLQDLIYDNEQLLAEDEIGIVVDLRKREDYLEHIASVLQKAEHAREKENTKEESVQLLGLALYYEDKGKGILWLAEKFYLAAIAVSSHYLTDGGRQKNCCKYHYAKFLLDKFPGADFDEAYQILTEVRDNSIGKSWLLHKDGKNDDFISSDTIFAASAVQLHRVLLDQARLIQKTDAPKAERLSRLAERRAVDAEDRTKIAEAIIEIGLCQLKMNNLNNALNTFERAFKIYSQINNIEGLCETRMHLSAVMQRLGDHEKASKLLTEMGAIAMEHGLRRQLGRALHLLGELYLRSERPELGTEHLAEAFLCFMGYNGFKKQNTLTSGEGSSQPSEIYEEEAEQSRLMMAISAGQELMASYFDLLRESTSCIVAQMKAIEWKLSHSAWWVKRVDHDLIPCMCSTHYRSPLDVMRIKLELKQKKENKVEQAASEEDTLLGRTATIDDIRKLRSSYINIEHRKVNVQ